MDALLSNLLLDLSKRGFDKGNIHTQGAYLNAQRRYFYEDCCATCGGVTTSVYNEEHLAPVHITPELGLFREMLHTAEYLDIIEEAVDSFVFPSDLPPEFNPYELELDELLVYTGFEDELVEIFGKSEFWKNYIREDYTETMRDHVWPVFLHTYNRTANAEDIATLVYRVTRARVYLFSISDVHSPVGALHQGDYCFAGACSEDITYALCMAYICARQIPPFDLLRSAVQMLDSPVACQHDELFVYLVLCAAAELSNHFKDLHTWIKDDAIGMQSSLDKFLDDKYIGYTLGQINPATMNRQAAWAEKIAGARASLSLQGIVPKFDE